MNKVKSTKRKKSETSGSGSTRPKKTWDDTKLIPKASTPLALAKVYQRVVDRRILGKNVFNEISIHPEIPDSIPVETRENFPHYLRSSRTRPTHFVSLSIKKPSVLSGIASVQNEIVNTHKFLRHAMIPAPRLHVSLALLRLDTLEQKSEAVVTVMRVLEELGASMQPITLRFRGLGVFRRGEVLFVRLTPELHFKHLHNFQTALRRRLGGLSLTGSNGYAEVLPSTVQLVGNPYDNWTPHLTIAKMKQIRIARMQKDTEKTVTPDIDTLVEEHSATDKVNSIREYNYHTIPYPSYSKFVANSFGEETFREVELCDMRGSRSNDGGYLVSGKAPLSFPLSKAGVSSKPLHERLPQDLIDRSEV